MNQAEIGKLVTRLKFKVQPKRWKIHSGDGDRGRLAIYKKIMTSLVVNERIEINKPKGIMVREYTERLISEATTHGDQHRPTMEMVDFWLTDKSAIHKLFKVLVPRYQDYPHSYTRLFNAPYDYKPEGGRLKVHDHVVLELKGHPFPPLAYSNMEPNRKLIHNVLLAEAKREKRLQKNFEREQQLKEPSLD